MNDKDPFKFAVMRHLEKIDAFMNNLKQKEIKIMATLEDVQAHVAQLATDEGKLVTFVGTMATENTAQKQQIADLQAKLASGAVINQADLDALDASISTVDKAITAAIPATQ